jgi:hypothetical protein
VQVQVPPMSGPVHDVFTHFAVVQAGQFEVAEAEPESAAKVAIAPAAKRMVRNMVVSCLSVCGAICAIHVRIVREAAQSRSARGHGTLAGE